MEPPCAQERSYKQVRLSMKVVLDEGRLHRPAISIQERQGTPVMLYVPVSNLGHSHVVALLGALHTV